MAYKIQTYVERGYNFAELFPDKQEAIRTATGLDFNLQQVVDFLKVQTNNFTTDNPVAHDLDEAVYKIIMKKEGQEPAPPEPPTPEPAPAPTPAPAPSPAETTPSIEAMMESSGMSREEVEDALNNMELLESLLQDDPSSENAEEWRAVIESLKDLFNIK